MAKQNQNRKSGSDNSEIKFSGVTINRDGELLAITECGKVFLVSGYHGSEPTWRQLTSYESDHRE